MHIFVFVNLGFFQRFFAQNLVVQNEKKKKNLCSRLFALKTAFFQGSFRKRKKDFFFFCG